MRQRSTHQQPQDYWKLSRAPLQVLFFLLPLMVAYELALPIWGVDSRNLPVDIYARRMIYDIFVRLGIRGEHLPMFIIIVVLVVWHVVRKDRWRFEPHLYAWMWFESLLYTLPLFVFSVVLSRLMSGPAGPSAMALLPLQSQGGEAMLGWRAEMVLAVGAGLYEELFFRLVGITLLHMVLVDYLKITKDWGTLLAVAATSLAFAFYHFNEQRPFQLGAFAFYTIAGLYFAGLFLYRGFGIAVAVHALYDIFVTLTRMMPADGG